MNSDFKPNLFHPSYLIRTRLLNAFTRLVPNLKGRLMDFGCGSKPYKSLFKVDEYIGVDYENPGHPHLNEQIDVFYDGKKLPFQNGYFDSVFSSEVFEHVFNLPDILKEINRVMKMEGQLLISCPFAYCEHEVPHDFARYSSYGIRHILQQNGFTIVMQEKTGNSIETIHQLLLTYLHYHVYRFIAKIPVVRTLFQVLLYGCINLSAFIWSKLLPKDKSLYLNNIVLCKKTFEAT